ncbi:hypothetical protein LP420_03780 [Massilia sp. B-10]|nr:hypothetical protein LP420_03780 [Massilia sp. B-10]
MPGMADSAWGQAHMAQLEAHQPFTDLEYPIRGEHGEQRWFCVNGEPVFDDQGVFA